VVHVHQPEYDIPLETTVTSPSGPPRTLGDLARSDARRRLLALVAEAGLDSIQPAETRVEVGAPHELIVTLAEQGRYALIVVGTRSVAGVLGGVAERLLSDAPCPVVTVPAPCEHAHPPGG
jgi:nucleotide-binding universal stress UspA family protein